MIGAVFRVILIVLSRIGGTSSLQEWVWTLHQLHRADPSEWGRTNTRLLITAFPAVNRGSQYYSREGLITACCRHTGSCLAT